MNITNEKLISEKIQKLEKQIEILDKKVQETIEYIELLKAENKKLQNDLQLLEEENKRLQGLYKDYLKLQSKTETIKQKLKNVIAKISQNI